MTTVPGDPVECPVKATCAPMPRIAAVGETDSTHPVRSGVRRTRAGVARTTQDAADATCCWTVPLVEATSPAAFAFAAALRRIATPSSSSKVRQQQGAPICPLRFMALNAQAASPHLFHTNADTITISEAGTCRKTSVRHERGSGGPHQPSVHNPSAAKARDGNQRWKNGAGIVPSTGSRNRTSVERQRLIP